MTYRPEVKAAGSRDAWSVLDRLDDALGSLRRAIRDAETCQLESVSMELGDVEDSLTDIMDALDEAAAWVDEGCPEDETEEP